MIKLIRKRGSKIGTAPGSVAFLGEQERTEAVTADLFDFTAEEFAEQRPIKSFDELLGLKDSETVSWVDVTGVHDPEVLHAFGDAFNIHLLTLEDIANTAQRPKLEEFADYLYIVIKMLTINRETETVEAEQVSIVVSRNWVVSFQEKPGDVFQILRQRLMSGNARVRIRHGDYLAYSLVDLIVDHYFLVLEAIGERIERLEDRVHRSPGLELETKLSELARELVLVRRAIWPVRELLSQLDRTESDVIEPTTRPFIRDAYDHAVQIIDIVESFRDVVSGLRESYRSAVSHRMNEIMKVLTIIATIFIPLTFVAGIYGMNFSYMPELQWHYGYFAALGAMAVLGIALVYVFRRNDWI